MKVDNKSIEDFANLIVNEEPNITKEQLKLHLLEKFVISNTDLPTIDRRKLQVLKFAYKVEDWVNNFYAHCLDIVEYSTKIKIKRIDKSINEYISKI